jgi:pyruvate/2-oxoglutarate dehydrogenase complex dihydrolipoamide acyltransferase (E2) component
MSIKESSNKKEALKRANQLEKKEQKKENMKEEKAKFLDFEAKLSNRDLLFSKAKKEFAERSIELKADKIYLFEIDAEKKIISFRAEKEADAESENSFKLLYRERIASFYFKKAHQEKIERAFEKKISELRYKIHFESDNFYIEIA